MREPASETGKTRSTTYVSERHRILQRRRLWCPRFLCGQAPGLSGENTCGAPGQKEVGARKSTEPVISKPVLPVQILERAGVVGPAAGLQDKEIIQELGLARERGVRGRSCFLDGGAAGLEKCAARSGRARSIVRQHVPPSIIGNLVGALLGTSRAASVRDEGGK
jgi:hypothetical protein